MLHTELERGDGLKIGNGLTLRLQRKHEDGSADFVLSCLPGSSFTYELDGQSACVEVRRKDGGRAKVSVDAPRSVQITKQQA